MQKITPHLWFDDRAEEAANFYVSIFKDGKLGSIARYPNTGQEITGKPPGSVMTVEFEIQGQKFIALNGGPQFKFSEAVSFLISCEDQAEIDYFWEKLTADGGEPGPCGWCKDKFGLSWQVIPTGMDEVFNDPDESKRERAMEAMLKMKKIDLAALRDA